jgi:hypothetical protein
MIGLALVIVFVAVERRIANPMLDLAPLRRPDFVGATVAALAAGAGVLALMSFVPTLIGRGLGGGALVAVAALFTRGAGRTARRSHPVLGRRPDPPGRQGTRHTDRRHTAPR